MDTVDKKTRSKIMSKVGQKSTGPETKLRKALFARGYRYRINVKKLPGSPDIVLPKYKVVIFVHGCFWHRHEGCRYATMPKTRVEFWTKKFKANVERDRRNVEKLLKDGWRVAIVWECAVKEKDETKFTEVVDELEKWIEDESRSFLELPRNLFSEK